MDWQSVNVTSELSSQAVHLLGKTRVNPVLVFLWLVVALALALQFTLALVSAFAFAFLFNHAPVIRVCVPLSVENTM